MQTVTTVAAFVLVYLNGQPFGRCTSFSWNSQTNFREIYGVDQAEPTELAPNITRIVGQVGILKTRRDGGLEGAGVTARFKQLTRQKYFSIMLVDRSTDTVLFQCDRAVCPSQSWDIQPKGVVAGSFSFIGLDWNNEVKSS